MRPLDGAPDTDTEGAGGDAPSAPEIVLAFDRATVELDALQRSVYALAAEVTADIRVSGTAFVCTLFPRRPDVLADELKHRFRAEVNDQSLRVRIARETEPIRNLVFALAFSRTGLVETEETA